MFRRSLIAVRALLLAFFLAGGAARANDAAQARKHYMEGEAEYALGHYDKALKQFEEAYKLSRKTALLFNIAQCHRQMKNFEMAATTYRSFIRLEPNSKQIERAEMLLAQVDKALKESDRTVKAAPLELSAQDKALAPSDEPAIEATAVPASESPQAEAKPAQDKPAEAKPAAAVIAAAVPRPTAGPSSAAPAAATEAAPAPSEPQRKRTLTWIAAGGAAAALGAGVLFGLQSKSTASTLSGGEHPRQEVDRLQSDLSSQAGKANLFFAVGAGLAAVSTALFVLKF